MLTKFFYVILQLIFGTILFSQHVPIDLDHPIYVFIRQEIAKGNLDIKYNTSTPLHRGTVLNLLGELERKSSSQIRLINRFQSEFTIKQIDDGIESPWKKEKLATVFRTLISSSNNYYEPHIFTFKDSQNIFWADLEEKITFKYLKKPHRIYRDRFAFSLFVDKTITIHTDFRMNRFVGELPIPEKISDYKEQWVKYYPEVNWSIWYDDRSLIHYEGKYLDIELSKTPLTWGNSPSYSPIFSSNTAPFPFIGIEKSFNRVRFKSIHGFLLPFDTDKIHYMNSVSEKNIAAHRLEIDFTSNFTASFSEMAVYGGRRFEMEYLLPLNWFWGSEHNLGDRDNILMAVDYSWRMNPGLIFYQTLLWDELDWAKLFKSWWGNKYVFQTGVYWVPFSNPKYPDFRIEWTQSRPWVYTHNDSLTTYTSGGNGLGFPYGPNSQMLFIEMNSLPSYNSQLTFSVSYIKKGSGPGSSPNDNYNFNDPFMDVETHMLMGEINTLLTYGINLNYRLTALISLASYINYNIEKEELSGQLALLLNY